MKKTLVALAVLAASGASFAQVTITGQYGFGYGGKTAPGSVTTSGLGITDSNISFAAGEDLGGGLKAGANIKLDGVSRAGVSGGDETIFVSGSFGTVTLGQVEYDTDLPDQFGTFLGATTISTVLVDSERTADFAQYSTSFGPVGVSVRHTENASTKGIGAGAAGTSGGSAVISNGSFTSGPTGQRLNTLGVSYAAGPLSAKFDYSAYDNKPDGVGGLYDSRTTLGGNYDFGVASIGLGVQSVKWTAPTGGSAPTVLDTFVGAKIPVGALVIGIDYLSTKLDSSGADAANKTYTGYGIQAQYNLSKRTDVRLRLASYDSVLGTAPNTDKTNSYQLTLQHSF